MTTYQVEFNKTAKKEWDNLTPTIQNTLAKKIKTLTTNPRIQKNALSGAKDCYKIKLAKSGFRLVYKVVNEELVIIVMGVGKRDKIYSKLLKKL